MADQNKSNKGPTNTVVDAIDESSFLTELERIGARAGRKTASRSELEQRIRSEGKLLNKLIEEGQRNPAIKEGPFYSQQVSGLRENIQGIRARMNSMESSAITRAESEASTYISRQFSQSSVNVQASGMMRQSDVQNRAFTMSGQSYDQLEARREEILAGIRQTERGALNEVKGMFGRGGQVRPESSAALGAMMSGTQDKFRELATINAAQQLQKISGIDPTSRMRNVAEMGKEANKVLSAENIANEIRQGGVNISQGGQVKNVANSDIQKEIIDQARQLSAALKELSEGANKTDEELSKLRESAEESAENLEKLQSAQGMGGGRGPSNSQIASAFAGGFGAIGAAAQQIMVSQRIGQANNVAGFANLANEQYDMYRKARAGDIMSQLTLGQYNEAEDFAIEMKRGTRIAQSAYTAGGVAQTAAGGFQVAEGLKDKATGLIGGSLAGTSGIATNQVISGTQNVVQGLATTATVGTDVARGVTSGQAMLEAAQAQIRARQAVMYVGATQMQGLRDYYTQLDVAAQGAGGRSTEFLNQSMSAENMSAMSAARLSPEQFAQMSQVGFEQIGSTFDTNQIFAARNLERGGFGSMQQNMQRMATLANAGANNPREGMENVLAAAMTKGLDSSKAISMMVENTAAMVSTSAGAAVGVDTTAATSSMLAAGVNKDMANKEFALQQAVTAAEITRQATTNRDVSFTGMANTAGIQRNLAEKGIQISGTEAMIAQGVDIATLKSLQGDPQKAAKFFQNKGVNIGKDNAEQFLDTMMIEKERQLLRPGGLAINADLEGLRKKVRSGDVKEGSEEFRQLGQIAELQGRKGGAEEIIREMKGLSAPNVSTGAAKDAISGKDTGDLKSQLDALRTSGFKQAAEAAEFAATKLKDFGGALQVFTELQNKFEAGGARSEDTFSKAAATMATDFKVSVGKFDSATTKYEQASQAILDGISAIKSNRNPVVPQAITDGMNKLRGSPAR